MEVQFRVEWLLSAAEELGNAQESKASPSVLIRKAIEVVSHAMAIYRILDPEDTSARSTVKERIELLREVWPDVPPPPPGLRDVRNHVEHFEERLDKWFASGDNSNVIDLVANITVRVEPGARLVAFRRLSGSILSFMDHSVDLAETCEWARNVADYMDPRRVLGF